MPKQLIRGHSLLTVHMYDIIPIISLWMASDANVTSQIIAVVGLFEDWVDK